MDYKLYILDLDGTLVKPFTDRILPGRIEKLLELDDAGKKIGVATNQGGVGLRYWMEQENWGEPEKFPTRDQVDDRLRSIHQQLEDARADFHFLPIVRCYAYETKAHKRGPVPPNESGLGWWDHEWRKPRPGMLLHLMWLFKTLPPETVMVGDMNEDRLAAFNAKCDFAFAQAFFGL